MSNNELLLLWYNQMKEWKRYYNIPDDCQQDVYLTILETDNDKLNQLQERGELGKWICGLMRLMRWGSGSKYNRAIKNPDTLYIEELWKC